MLNRSDVSEKPKWVQVLVTLSPEFRRKCWQPPHLTGGFWAHTLTAVPSRELGTQDETLPARRRPRFVQKPSRLLLLIIRWVVYLLVIYTEQPPSCRREFIPAPPLP